MEINYIRVLKSWFWLLLLIPILVGVGGYVYASNQPPTYRAVARLIIGPGIDSPNPSLDSLRTGALLMQSYAELAKTETFQRQVLAAVQLDIPVTDLADIVSLRPIIDTQILNIVVDYGVPEIAIALANQIADGMVALSPSRDDNAMLRLRMQNQAERLERSIVQYEQQLNQMRTTMENTYDPALQQILSQRIVEVEASLNETNRAIVLLYDNLQSPFTNQVEVVDRADNAPEIGSQVALTLVIAVGSGVLISLLLAALLVFLDMRLVDYDSLAKHTTAPLWGRVRRKKTRYPSDLRKLATTIIHHHKEHEVKSLLLTGIEDSNSAALLAADLAITLSSTGEKVILIDADQAAAVFARRFQLKRGPSLIDLLVKEPALAQLQPLQNNPNLMVVSRGDKASDAFSLIASSSLQTLLGRLKERAEYIIVVSPPLADFEQSMLISGLTDADIVVARQGKTRISELNRALSYLESVGGSVRGIVVTA